jgi:hypothetical protein
MKPGRARAMTALGLGLTVVAPAAAWAQQQQPVQQQAGACLERVEEIQTTLQTHQGAGMPNLSHLIEAARRYAAEGQEEQCLQTVDDMDEYLGRVARTPEAAQTGEAIRPDVPPPVEAVEGTGEEAEDDDGTGRAGDANVGAAAAGGGPQGGRGQQAVSPVEPPAPGAGTGTTTETTETFADVPPDELRVDRIVGQPLLNNWGKELGEIRDVVVAADDPDRAYAVVSREGGLLGDDEGLVVVELSRLRMAHQAGIQFPMGEDSPDLDDMPAYDPSMYRSLSQQQGQQGQQQPTGGAATTGTARGAAGGG